jgi:hypothetical protein
MFIGKRNHPVSVLEKFAWWFCLAFRESKMGKLKGSVAAGLIGPVLALIRG